MNFWHPNPFMRGSTGGVMPPQPPQWPTPSMGGALPPMHMPQIGTGGPMQPAQYPQPMTGGALPPMQPGVQTGGPMQPTGMLPLAITGGADPAMQMPGAHTGGEMPPQGYGYGLARMGMGHTQGPSFENNRLTGSRMLLR